MCSDEVNNISIVVVIVLIYNEVLVVLFIVVFVFSVNGNIVNRINYKI